jgi:hypothetical protein
LEDSTKIKAAARLRPPLLSVCNFLNRNLALSPDAAAFCNAALLTDLGPVLHLRLQDFSWKLADA